VFSGGFDSGKGGGVGGGVKAREETKGVS